MSSESEEREVNEIMKGLRKGGLSRRSILGGAALAVGGAALAACSSSTNGGNVSASSGTSLLQTIQSRGQLNITISLLYKPQMYKDSSGAAAGYDPDLLRALASDLRVTPNFIDTPDNAGNIANVQSGKADMVSAGLVNTPKRSLVLNFTRGYVPYTQVLIVPTSSTATSLDDLNQPGKVVTALTASTAFFRAQLLFPKATVTPLAQDEALLSVATGKADACLIEVYLATPFIAQHSNTKLFNNGQSIATEFGCWGILAGDYLFWRYLDNWVAYNTDNSFIPGNFTKTIGLPWVPPS
jgi:ABC-type amino acid transport substrate-binding protein